MNEHNILKKIKKHIYGKLQSIRITFPAGFQSVALQEIQAILANVWFKTSSTPEIIADKKEIVIHSISMFAVIELLIRSKTLSDIQLIIYQSKVHGKQSFKEKCAVIPWVFYLTQSMDMHIKINSVASRAFHETALKEILTDIIKPYVKSVGHVPAAEGVSLYAGLYKDKLVVSVSLAGEALYKRGYRHVLQAIAPLREDMAMACLKKVINFYESHVPNQTLTQLIVPFSGTGTLALEWLQHLHYLSSALFGRSYAVQDMPLYRKEHFQFILKKAVEHAKCHVNEPVHMLCIDSSTEANQVCEQNIISFHNALANYNISTQMPLIIEEDFFNIDAGILKTEIEGDILIVFNPPYGLRLGTQSQSEQLYKKIADKLNKLSAQVNKKMVGFILCPSEATWSLFLKNIKAESTDTYHFTQGGIDIRVCQFIL